MIDRLPSQTPEARNCTLRPRPGKAICENAPGAEGFLLLTIIGAKVALGTAPRCGVWPFQKPPLGNNKSINKLPREVTSSPKYGERSTPTDQTTENNYMLTALCVQKEGSISVPRHLHFSRSFLCFMHLFWPPIILHISTRSRPPPKGRMQTICHSSLT